jgi:putative holliday junction resolvase
LGTKTIGLAMAVLSVGIATPLRTLQRIRFQLDAQELMELIHQEEIDGIVLGLPLNMDGSAGPRVQATKAFARSLQAFDPPPILLRDERLTSSEAEGRMISAGVSVRRRAAMIDAAAARIILQDAVDTLRDHQFE